MQSCAVRQSSLDDISMSSLPDSSWRVTALRGDEKMASRGCMPCSSRSPVSFKKAPVFLFAPDQRCHRLVRASSPQAPTYRPRTPSSWRASGSAEASPLRPPPRGMMGESREKDGSGFGQGSGIKKAINLPVASWPKKSIPAASIRRRRRASCLRWSVRDFGDALLVAVDVLN